MRELLDKYGKTDFDDCKPAYDGRKGFYTAGALPFTSKDFPVKLIDKDETGTTIKQRECKVSMKLASRTDLKHLKDFLRSKVKEAPHETIQVLDVVLRESPSNRCTVVGRSFFSAGLDNKTEIGFGVECWKGFYQENIAVFDWCHEDWKGGELTHDETTIITEALDMTQKTAEDAMTPLSNVFSIDINSRLDGVHDHLPLYDILNQFQKGHGHMAVVVKCKNDVNKETAEITTAKAKFNTLEISIHSNPKPEIKEENGGNDSNSHMCLKKWEQHNGYVSKRVSSIQFRSKNCYRIKINMLPSHRSSSPGAAFASRQWSPLSSYKRTPLSSCNYTPVLRSPVSPYIQSPFIRPTLSASPGKAMPNSPAKFSGNAVYSPSSQRVM
ncbi:hypothetical protein QYF36_005500 [Acer negundo]|nr:hypothetical protein QYF36_005500 [Acer negundo]